jgi:hypothetical protein
VGLGVVVCQTLLDVIVVASSLLSVKLEKVRLLHYKKENYATYAKPLA